MMGNKPNVSHDKFPKQGKYAGTRVEVTFNYEFDNPIQGTMVRDDSEEPWETIIRLDDGRFIRGVECQYAPKDTDASTN